MFAYATSYGEDYQNQHQETLHTMTGDSPIVNGEIDHGEMPDLYFEESEEIMGWEAFKIHFLSNSDYLRAPNGPVKETPMGDSSQSVPTMQKCQEGMKDNPRSEMRQISHDNEFERKSSMIQGQPWQNGKAENQHSYIWLSQCSATAGAITQPD